MLTLDVLKAKAQQTISPPGEEDVTLLLDSDEDVESAVKDLFKYFGEDDKRQAIRLIVRGEEVGYLRRTDLYDFVPMETKGIGSSDHFKLPGEPRFRLFQLRCPIKDCTYRLLVMYFDKDNPPKCAIHPDENMEIL